MTYIVGDREGFYGVPEYVPQFFAPRELACKGSGALIIHVEAVKRLDELRRRLGPIRVHSGYRSPEHNVNVGGAFNSYHVQGKAFDVAIGDYEVKKLVGVAQLVGFTGLGFYLERQFPFVHVDIGPVRQWRG